MRPNFRIRLAALLLATAVSMLLTPHRLEAWGEYGHRLIAGAAVDALPPEMPAFFRDARSRLVALNPEPDRFRDRTERERDPALAGISTPDHYLDLELIPQARRAGALAAPDRYAFADSLRAVGANVSEVGAVPFAMLELAQRLRLSFRRWRVATDPETRAWLEQRILDDAGLLGHFVADASNPAHTTIHHNGWVGGNPNGYATDRRFHGRFESAFVQARVTAPMVAAALRRTPHDSARVHANLRTAVVGHVLASHALVDSLYALDRQAPFDTANASPAHARFAAARLAAGAAMLRDLWWSAWLTSAPDMEGAQSRTER
jgi:hypothetical protein